MCFQVFSKLASEETDFLEDPEDVTKIPKFGNSTTPYEEVHEFYAYWMAFATNKSMLYSLILNFSLQINYVHKKQKLMGSMTTVAEY